MANPSTEFNETHGIAIVFASALLWSFGGALARALQVDNSWTIVTWRAGFAAIFLFGFMLWRDGWPETRRMILAMRGPSLLVALSFTTASTCFVVALAHTSVANILLIQAGVPLIAALMTWVLFGEMVARSTWVAILLVIVGVGVMVSGSFSGKVSPVGDALAVLIALAFATATVTTRRYAGIRMVPACWLGIVVSFAIAASLAPAYRVGLQDGVILFAFGALSLGFGMALFVTGARMIPATMAALVSVAEPVLGPIWTWLFHAEVPAFRTLIGGSIVLLALLLHIGLQLTPRNSRA